MPAAAHLKEELEKTEQRRRRRKDKSRNGTVDSSREGKGHEAKENSGSSAAAFSVQLRQQSVSNESAGELIRSGLIPPVSNEHLRGLHGGNNGAFGSYLTDESSQSGSDLVREELDKGTYTVKAGGDKAAFTPSHYASYLQIWGSPRKAVEYYTRYLELKDKKKAAGLDPEESRELDQLERLEQSALEFDDARHYMQDKKAYGQQDIDYAFAQNRHRKGGSDSELFGTAHSYARMYQTFFLDGIFGGMKEKYLQNESDGGISREAIEALKGGGTPENLEGMKKWLDAYLEDCVKKQKRGMTMILRGISRSDPKHTRVTITRYLENVLSGVYFKKEFVVTDTDTRMLMADRYLARALRLLMRDPGSRFSRMIRQILERILAEKV